MVPGGWQRILCALSLASLSLWAQAQSPDGELIRRLRPGQSVTSGTLTYTLHQKDAGRPDQKGQYLAHAQGGGYSVVVPAPFYDLTAVAPAKDGATIKFH